MAHLLHPPLLDEPGLLPALHWYFTGFQKRCELRISFDYKPANLPRLPRELETAIFRIIQEALTNTYRHSGSDDARIELQQDSERVTIRIRDFGKGIGPTAGANGRWRQFNERTSQAAERRTESVQNRNLDNRRSDHTVI